MYIYDDNGYFNAAEICAAGYPFVFAVGGRGTGKSYSTLKYALDSGEDFLYLRRTQAQADLAGKEDFSPFKPINRDTGSNIQVRPVSKYNSAIVRCDSAGELVGQPIGYTAALSTFANIRSFDASTVKRIIYDEFIPEPHERPLRAEAEALLNVYESVARNRETTGEDPLQLICLANSNNLANPIFLGLGLVSSVDQMQRKGRELWTDDKRGIMVISLLHSPISTKKRETAVYRMAGDSAFSRMALSNRYADADEVKPRRRPISEMLPVVSVGELCIYRHKSDGRYYVTQHMSGSHDHFVPDRAGLPKFWRQYHFIWDEFLQDNVDFENINCYALFTNYHK